MPYAGPMPHESLWRLMPKPFKFFAEKPFRCMYCGGEMIISHGHIFTFMLRLHGDAKKRSYAIDVWQYCQNCQWTTVNGVAIPEDTFNGFVELVSNAGQINEKGEQVKKKDRKEIKLEPGESLTIYPSDPREKDRGKSTAMWAEEDSIVGLRPLFPMTCKYCAPNIEADPEAFKGVARAEDGGVKMFLRHSRLHLVRRDIVKRRFKFFKTRIQIIRPMGEVEKIPSFRVSYKCPVCDFLATFVVPVRQEHFDRTLEYRGGEPLYYPPLDEWQSEDELIQRKLEELGYV